MLVAIRFCIDGYISQDRVHRSEGARLVKMLMVYDV